LGDQFTLGSTTHVILALTKLRIDLLFTKKDDPNLDVVYLLKIFESMRRHNPKKKMKKKKKF
jgi:hypothetical protein